MVEKPTDPRRSRDYCDKEPPRSYFVPQYSAVDENTVTSTDNKTKTCRKVFVDRISAKVNTRMVRLFCPFRWRRRMFSLCVASCFQLLSHYFFRGHRDLSSHSQLKQYFSRFGSIDRIEMYTHPVSAKPLGIALLHLDDPATAHRIGTFKGHRLGGEDLEALLDPLGEVFAEAYDYALAHPDNPRQPKRPPTPPESSHAPSSSQPTPSSLPGAPIPGPYGYPPPPPYPPYMNLPPNLPPHMYPPPPPYVNGYPMPPQHPYPVPPGVPHPPSSDSMKPLVAQELVNEIINKAQSQPTSSNNTNSSSSNPPSSSGSTSKSRHNKSNYPSLSGKRRQSHSSATTSSSSSSLKSSNLRLSTSLITPTMLQKPKEKKMQYDWPDRVMPTLEIVPGAREQWSNVSDQNRTLRELEVLFESFAPIHAYFHERNWYLYFLCCC